MAEGLKSSQLVSGSEPVYDFFCEICIEDGQNIEAEGYCTDCNDYLCRTCLTHHKRSRLTIRHQILDKQAMPKDKPLEYDRWSRIIETKCSDHYGKIVKYFCKQHGVLGCGTCIIMNHRTCENVVNISEISDDFCQGKEFTEFLKRLRSICQMTSAVEILSNENIRLSETSCIQTVDGIRQWRKEINDILDDIESRLIKQAESVKAENLKAMESLCLKVKTISDGLVNITSEIEQLQKSKKNCQLYISMKQSFGEITRLKTSLDEVTKNNSVQLSDFESNTKLKDICKDIAAFGKLNFRDSDRAIYESPVQDILEPWAIKATPMPDIDLSSNRSRTSFITGLVVLSRNRIIAVDFNNWVVSLVDTKDNTFIYDLKVDSETWDVCAISETQAVVTLRNKCQILLLKVSDKLTEEKKIKVNGKCSGIAYSRDRLVVTSIEPPKLDIMDLYGNVIRTIEYNHEKLRIFQRPQYGCVGRDGSTIYVSDTSANKVLHVSFNGDVISEYTDRELKDPEKVCTDGRGNIYVACFKNRTVHLMTADCSKIKILLTERDGLNNVLSVSHCPDTDRLYVGMYNNHIKVFQLE